MINSKLIQELKNSLHCIRSFAKICLTYISQILKTNTILYVKFHICIRSVCDMYFPSFKSAVMFVTCILFHLKRYVRDKHSLSFKTLAMFVMHILFHLKRLYCLRRTISFIQNVRNVYDTHSYYIAFILY